MILVDLVDSLSTEMLSLADSFSTEMMSVVYSLGDSMCFIMILELMLVVDCFSIEIMSVVYWMELSGRQWLTRLALRWEWLIRWS